MILVVTDIDIYEFLKIDDDLFLIARKEHHLLKK